MIVVFLMVLFLIISSIYLLTDGYEKEYFIQAQGEPTFTHRIVQVLRKLEKFSENAKDTKKLNAIPYMEYRKENGIHVYTGILEELIEKVGVNDQTELEYIPPDNLILQNVKKEKMTLKRKGKRNKPDMKTRIEMKYISRPKKSAMDKVKEFFQYKEIVLSYDNECPPDTLFVEMTPNGKKYRCKKNVKK